MNILSISDKSSLKTTIEVLKSNGIVIFPTDTVYGIGCVLNKAAIRKLYKIKNRPANQPTAVLMTKKLFGDVEIDFPKEFWNGQMTVIMPANKFKFDFPKMILGDDKIGVRLPKYKWLEKLIDQVGPIVTTSANRKGDRPPKNFTKISPELIKQVDLTIQTDEKLDGIPSKIFDLEKKLVIRS